MTDKSSVDYILYMLSSSSANDSNGVSIANAYDGIMPSLLNDAELRKQQDGAIRKLSLRVDEFNDFPFTESSISKPLDVLK
jgi:hypothetical protein